MITPSMAPTGSFDSSYQGSVTPSPWYVWWSELSRHGERCRVRSACRRCGVSRSDVLSELANRIPRSEMVHEI